MSTHSDEKPQERPADRLIDRDAETLTGSASPDDAKAFFVDAPKLPVPEKIGAYRIERLLGQGGMGAVYLAEQQSPRRTVALKLIRPGATSRELLRRFEIEAQVLGRLHHPGIAQIYEAGMFDAGHGAQPFFAMEYVRGRPLSELIAEKSLAPRAALELLARICDAVHHAHQKGVIHRDLKPSNILIERESDQGGGSRDRHTHADVQPKVLDFGVARATDADLQATTMQTSMGQLIGTLPYMSPEQVLGDPNELDIRSDVYALGVIGYEMLAGRLPHDLGRVTVATAARVITEEEPASLSSFNRVLRGDVETIITKALEKDKTRRYQSAADLAADIRRYLNDEPIVARPPTTMYQLAKFARRNRALVGGLAATFIVLVLGVIFSVIGFARAVEQRERAEHEMHRAQTAETEAMQARDEAEASRRTAEREMARAQAINQFLVRDLLGAANPAVAQGEVPTVEMVLDAAAQRVDESLADEPELAGFIHNTLGETYLALGKYEQALAEHEAALEKFRRTTGPTSPSFLREIVNIASAQSHLGRPADAERTLREHLPAMEEHLGPEHSTTLVARSVLATTFSDQARYDEAESLFGALIQTQKRVLGEDHEDTQITMNNYAYLLSDLGRIEEAEPLFRQIYVGRQKELGELHPRTLTAMMNLAVTLSELLRYDEAESLYRELLETSRRVLGDEHPSTHSAMSNLAVFLSHLGRLEEAVPMMRETCKLIEASLGVEHPNAVMMRVELASLLRMAGATDEAIEIGEAAVAASIRVSGAEHPGTLNALNALGVAYYVEGQLDRAAELFHQVYEGRRNTLGDEHPQTLIAMNNTGAAYLRLGRLDEAEPLLVGVLKQRQTLYGTERPDVYDSCNLLGSLREEQSRYNEAIELYEQAREGRTRFYGPAHSETLSPARGIVRAMLKTSRFEQAEQVALDALSICTEAHGEDASLTQELRALLADLYEAWGRPEQAAVYRPAEPAG